jgi:quinol monooxygenase YgiN
MIIRVFRARIRVGKVAEFKRLVREQSIPWLERSPGMLGYFAGEPLSDDEHEFVMVTLWQDMESLKAFVGDNWKTPVVTADETPLVEEMVITTHDSISHDLCQDFHRHCAHHRRNLAAALGRVRRAYGMLPIVANESCAIMRLNIVENDACI